MPKGKTSRPYNRSQKSEVKRNKAVGKRAAKTELAKSSFKAVSGPGRASKSAGQMAQARRSLGASLDKITAKKIKGKRGRK